MAEHDDISRRYRNLPPEEPPRRVDDAIRAAARRAVEARPAPLVAPTGRQGWTFPLAAAAIIVLAVAVTMHVEREQPSEEIVSAPAAPAEAPILEKPQSVPEPERRRKTEGTSAELRDAAPPPASPPATPQGSMVLEQKAAGAVAGRAEAPQSAPARQPAPPPANAELRRSDDSSRAAASVSANGLQSPEQWLQRIADLRRQGRHDEADKALAEFRKRYPDYRISKDVLEQVEKR